MKRVVGNSWNAKTTPRLSFKFYYDYIEGIKRTYVYRTPSSFSPFFSSSNSLPTKQTNFQPPQQTFFHQNQIFQTPRLNNTFNNNHHRYNIVNNNNNNIFNNSFHYLQTNKRTIHTSRANIVRVTYLLNLIARNQLQTFKRLFNETNQYLLLFLFALFLIGYKMQEKIQREDEENGLKQMGINRGVLDVVLGRIFSLFPDSLHLFWVSYLHSSDSLFFDRLSTYLLLMRSLTLGDKEKEDEIINEQLLAVFPKISQLDGELNLLIANLLLSILETQVISKEGREDISKEILNAICELASNYPPIDDSLIPQNRNKKNAAIYLINNPIVLAIAEFSNKTPEIAREIVDKIGYEAITAISMSAMANPNFFYPIIKSLSELSNLSQEEKEKIVKNGVMKMMEKAVKSDYRKKVQTAVGVKLNKDSPYNHKKTIYTKHDVMVEVARCIGNLVSPSLSLSSSSSSQSQAGMTMMHQNEVMVGRLINEGCLKVLRMISQELNATHAHLYTARAIANITSIEKGRLKVAEEGWMAILQHWIKTECKRSITSDISRPFDTLPISSSRRPSSSSSDNNNNNNIDNMTDDHHGIDDHHHSRNNNDDEEKDYSTRKKEEKLVLSACAVVGLANIASINASYASDSLRNLSLSDILYTLSKEQTSLSLSPDDHLRETAEEREGRERLSGNVNVMKEQLARWLSILSNYHVSSIASDLISSVGLSGLSFLIHSPSSSSSSPSSSKSIRHDLYTTSYIIQTLASLSLNKKIAEEIMLFNKENWIGIIEELMYTTPSTNLLLLQRLSRLLANLAFNQTTAKAMKERKKIEEKMKEWISSEDMIISSNAIRYHAALSSIEVKGPKYAEGVHLLYPSPPSSSSSSSSSPPTYEFDIVFLHGIQGHPIDTWRSLSNSQVCWPRDWLPERFPGSRIISISYDVFMSKWIGQSLPIKDQAVETLQKLLLAKVGDRPVIFVTHSFGGLLLKQLLKLAKEDEGSKKLIEATKGVVFYSTPHRGADIAALADSLFFRKTSTLIELDPRSTSLSHLNEQFEYFAPKVNTLSFGENNNTCVGSSYTCFQIVSDESSNPNFRTKADHRFLKLDKNHYQVCKPESKEDPAFAEVVDFIIRSLFGKIIVK